MSEFDIVVVGTGFAGAVVAERAASVLGKRVLVLDKRYHIAGNAFDEKDEWGVLVHKYGPHIFHTKIPEVWDYLSRFTEWNIYHHRVKGLIDGQLLSIPFNLDSLRVAMPESLADRIEMKLISRFGYNVKVPILKLLEEDDSDLKLVANYIYEKVFLNYTMKQWGVRPEEMDSTVTSRVPIFVGRDARYFQDGFQAMPKHGYTKMFEKILFRKNIHVMLNTDFKDVMTVNQETGEMTLFGQAFEGTLIYTGQIDSFFNYKFGKLPYRSLRFEFENLLIEQYQSTGTVNYPNDYDFTRITEFKHLTGQQLPTTTIVREYPEPYEEETNNPYYPIKNPMTRELYQSYHEETKRFRNVHFVGRLAEYQYYDMDAVVAKALKVFRERVSSL